MAARILIVDDDATIRRLVRINLELEGYEVIEAVDGRAALEAVDQENPDLVVCDVMMPELDGIEVISRIRQSGKDIPVIILSAKAQRLDVKHGLAAGADEYITKPFDPDYLIESIRRLIQ